MQFHYEIDVKRGSADQVGLRLRCVSQLQAEEIHRAFRQHFRVSRLMSSSHPDYTQFVYVTATEAELRETMPTIEALCSASSAKVAAAQAVREAKAAQDFKSWQTQFCKAVKQLNADSPSPTSLVQEIGLGRLEQQIAAGLTNEVEELLLRRTVLNDSNTLRALIALYTQTGQSEKIVELCETRRTEVLALPVSGLLVEQIVSAYLEYQQPHSQDLLRSATQLAHEFLPELERLRQAEGVRRLLHQALTPQEPLLTETGATLKEQLAQLVEIEPTERLPQLEFLHSKHPQAVSVLLALAASIAALGDRSHALELYQSVPVKTEAEREEIQQRCAEIQLDTGRFSEVINLLPDSQELTPTLAGLRGAALYHTGQKFLALPFLEKAWHKGERSVQVLLPLARLWANNRILDHAAEAYQVLLETAVNVLTAEDYAAVAAIADGGGFGDISDEEVVSYYERCLDFGWSNLRSLPTATLEELLLRRFSLRTKLHDTDKLLNAYADLLEWLANGNRITDLEKVLAELRTQVEVRRISRKQQFELLEIVEPFVKSLPQLRQSLLNDYQSIAFADIDEALRYERSEEAFFKDLIRALLLLDSSLAQEINEYRQECYAQAASLGVQPSLLDDNTPDTINLSSLRLALVGGHEATRREVIRELQQGHGLEKAVEVAPASVAYVDRSSVQAKISGCGLIAVITGYMGHDLSKIVFDLKKDGALVGEVLLLPCRGKSGVVREILNWWVAEH